MLKYSAVSSRPSSLKTKLKEKFKMKKQRTLFITKAALIAALYVVLTGVSAMFNLSSGVIQLRLSEALTILPIFTPAAIPGLFFGCALSNFLYGALPLDVLFGSIATLIGAFGTYYIGRVSKYLAPIPPILANTVIVPLVLKYVYCLSGGIPFFALTVFIGEVLSCGVLGLLLMRVMPKHLKEQLK